MGKEGTRDGIRCAEAGAEVSGAASGSAARRTLAVSSSTLSPSRPNRASSVLHPPRGPRDKLVQQHQRFVLAPRTRCAMKRTTVGGLDAPAGTPQGVPRGGAIDHTRRRPSQAGSMGRRPLCLQPVHVVLAWRTRKQP